MRRKFILLLFLAISLFALGVFFAIPFWYYGKWKDGLGTEPVFIIIIAWALGMGVLLVGKVLKYSIPFKEIGVLIATIWITDSLVTAKKHDNIVNNQGTTYANVLFKGEKYLHGFGIDYSYTVNGSLYYKWDNCADFIEQEKLSVGDSVKIVYNKRDPHMHEFEALLNVQ